MNVTVQLVEDEKAARDFFLAVLEGETEGFTALPPAVNGREGWERIKEQQPDVLVTDIRMPLMDGLELVEKVSREFPRIITLVLSGYQEFDYAREAFTHGVEDYLLKPLNIDQFKGVMNRVRERLENRDRDEEISLVRKIGEDGYSEQTSHLNGNRLIRLGMIRKGGLMARFARVERNGQDRKDSGILIMEGRDRNERIYIADADHMSQGEFKTYLENVQTADRDHYQTRCLYPEQFPLRKLRQALEYVRERTDRNITLGQSKTLTGRDERTVEKYYWSDGERKSLEYLLLNRNYGKIRRVLDDRLRSWEQEEYPLFLLESSLKELLIILQRQNGAGRSKAAEEEILLELYLSESRSYKELSENLWSLVRSILGLGESPLTEEDLPEIFRGLCIYLENHFGENLRLAEISDYFNISPSYISRLFSRHFHCSFSDYVRHRRIEGARELISLNPDMPVQDVARYCGYEDPFYFSKVFKHETGISPSQFKKGRADN